MACPKLEQETIQPANNSILGTWQWVESNFITRGMSEPEITTPSGIGHQMALTFNNDLSVDLLLNGQQVTEYKYEFRKEAEDAQRGFLSLTPVTNNQSSDLPVRPTSGPCRIQNDTLTIYGGYNDAGPTQKFVRVE